MKIEPNNIYLGDSYELIKNIPDNSIDLIYTDIPYLTETKGGGIYASSIEEALFKEKQQEKTLVKGINYDILNEFCRVLKGIYIYIYGAVKIKFMILCRFL